ncbi:MAG: site-specific integrase [Bacteroides sp.]|nr:site-specific integrase [Bacteroides sp.]
MTPITRYIGFKFHDRLPLRIRVRWAKYEVQISVGFVVEKEKWDKNHCIRNTTHGSGKISAAIINKRIDLLLDKINEIFYSFEIIDIIPTKDQFKSLLEGESQRKTPSLEAAWNTFIREGVAIRQWAPNTVKSINQVRDLFLKFNNKIELHDLNEDVLNDFIAFQQTHQLLNNHKGYANNVIEKHCNILKRFLKWAVKKEYLERKIIDFWTPNIKTIPKPIIFLTWAELMRVYELDLSQYPILEVDRDIFCFMCFTSLRYSDAISLRKEDIQNGQIILNIKKTSKNIRIELNKYSIDIMMRYMRSSQSGLLFPHRDNQDINNNLRIIARMAKIDRPTSVSQYYGNQKVEKTAPKYEFITTHCGRRTFVCNALMLGIPLHIIIKWTGHSDISAMKPYMDIADDMRRSEMGKFDEI